MLERGLIILEILKSSQSAKPHPQPIGSSALFKRRSPQKKIKSRPQLFENPTCAIPILTAKMGLAAPKKYDMLYISLL